MTDNNDATGDRLTIFPEPRGYRTYLVRVNPRHERIIDPFTHDPIFESLHNIESCIGDDRVALLADVRAALVPFTEERYDDETRHLLADLDLYNVLSHPRSPYGLGWKPKAKRKKHDHPLVGQMHVTYRQGSYTRDDEGVLHRIKGVKHDLWPNADTWRVNAMRVRHWARGKGLLP
jgi:hypothetical protein